jgi:hypothetical protein
MANAKSGWLREALLRLFFHGTTIDGLAQNDGTSPVTDIVVAFHTADPGVGGSQATSEIAYTGYARELIPRDATGFTLNGAGATATISPAADYPFGKMTGGAGGTITHVSFGTGVTDAIMYRGAVTPTLVEVNVTPKLMATTTISED